MDDRPDVPSNILEAMAMIMCINCGLKNTCDHFGHPKWTKIPVDEIVVIVIE